MLEHAYSDIAQRKLISEYVTPTETGEAVSPQQQQANAAVTQQNLMNQRAQEVTAQAQQQAGVQDPRLKDAIEKYEESLKKIEQDPSEDNINASSVAFSALLDTIIQSIKSPEK